MSGRKRLQSNESSELSIFYDFAGKALREVKWCHFHRRIVALRKLSVLARLRNAMV